MTDEQDAKRDYLSEARRIIEGTGLMKLAQREHLVALDQQLGAMNRNIVTLGEILLAILADNGVPAMQIPASALERIRATRAIPIIQRQPDGAIVVRTTGSSNGAAPASTRVM